MTDRIVAGDKVSFALPIPGAIRTFGTVYRVARKRNQVLGTTDTDYGVRDENGLGHLVPARFVTKECG